MGDIPPLRNLPPDAEPWGRFIENQQRLLARGLDALAQASGNGNSALQGSYDQLAQQLQTLTDLTVNLVETVENLASSGVTWAGPVSTSGNIVANTITATNALNSTGTGEVTGVFKNPAAYTNPITTSFRAVWVTSVDGQYGFNLSTIRSKQDVEDAFIDPATVLLLRLVWFRYIAAVEAEGDAAETHLGLIAEEVHELGLTWLVEYDDEGLPCGIKFHLLAMALLAVAQNHEERLQALES